MSSASDVTTAPAPPTDPNAHITVRNLTMAYGSFVLMRDLTFTVKRGDVFVIMGGSGCGKSTPLNFTGARSVRLLAEYLERNPSSVVRGKEVSKP